MTHFIEILEKSIDVFEDIVYDNGIGPPGWARVNGVSMRIIARETALRGAISACAVQFMRHPAAFRVNAGIYAMITRDARIELGRAVPPYNDDEKDTLVRKIYDSLRAILIRLAECDIAGDFYDVYRASADDYNWDISSCNACGIPRTLAFVLCLVMPCGHVLCFAPRCKDWKFDEICPECDGIIEHQIRIDNSLVVPNEIVEQCFVKIR